MPTASAMSVCPVFADTSIAPTSEVHVISLDLLARCGVKPSRSTSQSKGDSPLTTPAASESEDSLSATSAADTELVSTPHHLRGDSPSSAASQPRTVTRPERATRGGRAFASLLHREALEALSEGMPDLEGEAHDRELFEHFMLVQGAGCMPDLEGRVHGGTIFANFFTADKAEPQATGD